MNRSQMLYAISLIMKDNCKIAIVAKLAPSILVQNNTGLDNHQFYDTDKG